MDAFIVDWLFELFYDRVEKRWGKLAAWIATLLLFGLLVISMFYVLAWFFG